MREYKIKTRIGRGLLSGPSRSMLVRLPSSRIRRSAGTAPLPSSSRSVLVAGSKRIGTPLGMSTFTSVLVGISVISTNKERRRFLTTRRGLSCPLWLAGGSLLSRTAALTLAVLERFACRQLVLRHAAEARRASRVVARVALDRWRLAAKLLEALVAEEVPGLGLVQPR